MRVRIHEAVVGEGSLVVSTPDDIFPFAMGALFVVAVVVYLIVTRRRHRPRRRS